MADKKDGGAAFPTVDANDEHDYGTRGMTLRDYFAAKAMQGVIGNLGRIYEAKQMAADAYAIADLMLKAREAEK